MNLEICIDSEESAIYPDIRPNMNGVVNRLQNEVNDIDLASIRLDDFNTEDREKHNALVT